MERETHEFERILVLIEFGLLDAEEVRRVADTRILESEVAEEPWLSLSVAKTLQDAESILVPLVDELRPPAFADGVDALRVALEEGRIQLRQATQTLYKAGLKFSGAGRPLWEAGVRLDDDLDEVAMEIEGYSKTFDEVRAETLETLRQLPTEIREGGTV